ncbi:hypothetical protein GDN83_15905 [Gordonia jinghuaiqii]|uniref:Uncharacterized protein n=1 Tax=Gordonia jinghuaiqii TaxID=2758710 RepID=A0A7D7RP83_9ACTN|nr:hypothetical protein [Gordonia jinghuaiqii]MCR5979199.1 hypothetical protein [Gordonia jinghuaiqii]QMT00993.1 hypothetical protein H1R19_19330 [Gordonia jinghuaiqii]
MSAPEADSPPGAGEASRRGAPPGASPAGALPAGVTSVTAGGYDVAGRRVRRSSRACRSADKALVTAVLGP